MKRFATIFVFGLFGCSEAPHVEPAPQRPAVVIAPAVPAAESPVVKATDVDETLAKLQASIEFYQRRFDDTGSWMDAETIVEARLARARLSGDIADYLAAGQALDAAFTGAKPGAGPFLSSAGFNMVVHQIDRSEASLDQYKKRIWLKDAEKAAIAGLEGDIAFHRGDLAGAFAHFEDAEKIDPTTASAGRLANYFLRTGDYEKARSLYASAESRVSSTDAGKRAWAILQRGVVELEAGNLDAALAFVERANTTYSGWYLIEEHLAEITLLKGEAAQAIELYKNVIQRVPNGEFYAALGDAHAEAGQPELAQAAYAQAKAAFERDIAKLPSAASGHAIDFYLAHDYPRALDLARQNFVLRPGHEARTKLAQALLANGNRPEALEVLKPTMETEWATVDFLATASLVLAGDPARAEAYRQRAEAVDSSSVDALSSQLGL